jgi:hypothetical protein
MVFSMELWNRATGSLCRKAYETGILMTSTWETRSFSVRGASQPLSRKPIKSSTESAYENGLKGCLIKNVHRLAPPTLSLARNSAHGIDCRSKFVFAAEEDSQGVLRLRMFQEIRPFHGYAEISLYGLQVIWIMCQMEQEGAPFQLFYKLTERCAETV